MSSTIWTEHAGELAEWTMERLVNRSDCFGAYLNGQGTTVKKTLTAKHLIGHFRNKWIGGLHAISTDSTSRWLCIDIDAHGPNSDAIATAAYAGQLWYALEDRNLEPLVFSSDGNGSFHAYVLFEEPIAAANAYDLGQWIVREVSPPDGIAPEVFPKQRGITNGEYGSWVRLPGHHHRLEVWHSLWADGRLHNAETTVNTILKAEGVNVSKLLADLPRAVESTKPVTLELPPSDLVERVLAEPPDEGDRNNALFRVACDLAGRGFDLERILEAVSDPFRKSGLSDREIRTTVSSVIKKPRDPALARTPS